MRLFRHPAWAPTGNVTYNTLTLANTGGSDGFITKYKLTVAYRGPLVLRGQSMKFL